MPNSRKFKPETEKALEAGRVGRFVFFDFMFFPMRVHSGKETMEWDGQIWQGVGDSLKTSFRIASIFADPPPYSSASLPWDKTTSEVVTKGYYRGRTMEIFLCSLDERSNVIERVAYVPGTMDDEFSHKDNVITFKARDDTLDSTAEKDARHKKTVEAYRQQFKWHWSGVVSSSALGWAMNIIGAAAGNFLGICVDVLLSFMPEKRRAVVQRWRARKRVYWFTTEPEIPRIRKRKRGCRVRADTLDEAKIKLYREVIAKIWMFPVEYIRMTVYCDGSPLELFDLDHVRKQDDMKRWEETSPINQWAKMTDKDLK